jgi:hypothetical protein
MIDDSEVRNIDRIVGTLRHLRELYKTREANPKVKPAIELIDWFLKDPTNNFSAFVAFSSVLYAMHPGLAERMVNAINMNSLVLNVLSPELIDNHE